MITMKEVELFTCRFVIVSGPRGMVEASVRTMEYIYPRSHRNYSMTDLSGQWKVCLVIPR